jgi:hypothetical protein
MKRTSTLIFLYLLIASILITGTFGCNLPGPSLPALVIAVRFEGKPALTVYVGEPQEHSFWLPTGEYYFEVMDSEGMIYDGWREVIKPVLDGGDSITISTHVRESGQPDEVIAAQLHCT